MNRILFIFLCFTNFCFAKDDSLYYKLRDNFNKGYYSQILSSEFGSAASNSTSEKLHLIQMGIPKTIKSPSKEPTINELDYLGMAPIHYFAATRVESQDDYPHMYALGKYIISLGADVNLPNEFGIKPIKLAIAYGNYAAVKAFLETGKLQKDISLFRTLFSEDLDDKWQLFRERVLFGKVQIWKMLEEEWIPKEEAIFIHLANLRTSTIKNYLEFNPRNEIQAEFRRQTINENLKAVNTTLNVIIDTIEAGNYGHDHVKELLKNPKMFPDYRAILPSKSKFAKIPGRRFSVEIKREETIPAQKVESGAK